VRITFFASCARREYSTRKYGSRRIVRRFVLTTRPLLWRHESHLQHSQGLLCYSRVSLSYPCLRCCRDGFLRRGVSDLHNVARRSDEGPKDHPGSFRAPACMNTDACIRCPPTRYFAQTDRSRHQCSTLSIANTSWFCAHEPKTAPPAASNGSLARDSSTSLNRIGPLYREPLPRPRAQICRRNSRTRTEPFSSDTCAVSCEVTSC